MRLRGLASGDHHFNVHSRLDECVRVHHWMVGLAHSERVDLFLSGGDVHERLSSIAEREAVDHYLLGMASVCPVLITRGNHDRPGDLLGYQRLSSAHPIIVEERAGVHHIAGAAIAAVAWPERTTLVDASWSPDEVELRTREALQGVLRGLGDELERHAGPRILLGHFMVDGSKVSTGQRLEGLPINVGLTELALARASLGLMSHVHMPQAFDVGGNPHVYMGSPYRTDFGQLEKKTVRLFEFDDDRLVMLEEIETPATPMVHLEDQWGFDVAKQADGWLYTLHGYEGPEGVRGAEVRFRYYVQAHKREAAREQAELVARQLEDEGALVVKTEVVIQHDERARTPEIGRAESVVDKLPLHWQAMQFEPGPRRQPMLAKAALLEQLSRDE